MKTELEKTELEQANEWVAKKPYKDYLNLVDKYPQTNLTNNEQLVKIWKKETQEYNETFNPEAHSHLIIDFDKHELLLTEAIESNKVETIEEYLNREYPDKGYDEEYYCDINLDIIKPHALQVALSDTVKNYWFKIFQEEQKGQNKHHKN